MRESSLISKDKSPCVQNFLTHSTSNTISGEAPTLREPRNRTTVQPMALP